MSRARLQEEDDLPGRRKPNHGLARSVITALYFFALWLTFELRRLGQLIFSFIGRGEGSGVDFEVLAYLHNNLSLVFLALAILWGVAQMLVASKRHLWVPVLLLAIYTSAVGLVVYDLRGVIQ